MFWRTGDLDREVLATVECAEAQLLREWTGNDCDQEETFLCDRRYKKRQKGGKPWGKPTFSERLRRNPAIGAVKIVQES